MAKRQDQMKVDHLSRLLVYVLGHRPDEFGLVPSPDGFMMIKELMQAVREEPNLSFIREGHLREVLMGKDRASFEISGHGIRALDRRWLIHLLDPEVQIPKILYTPVRSRAHPVVLEKGLRPGDGRHVVLSQDQAMALRIGKRRDPEPILLEIMAESAKRKGVSFSTLGDLFLCGQIPADLIAGPPVPKKVLERHEAEPVEMRLKSKPIGFTAGSFLLDPSRDPDPMRKIKGRKAKGWKEQARKIRRVKSS